MIAFVEAKEAVEAGGKAGHDGWQLQSGLGSFGTKQRFLFVVHRCQAGRGGSQKLSAIMTQHEEHDHFVTPHP